MIRVAVRRVLLCQDFVKQYSRYREIGGPSANAMEERIETFPRGDGFLSRLVPFVVPELGLRNFTLPRGIIVRNTLDPGI